MFAVTTRVTVAISVWLDHSMIDTKEASDPIASTMHKSGAVGQSLSQGGGGSR
jgi:hypothetical protein